MNYAPAGKTKMTGSQLAEGGCKGRCTFHPFVQGIQTYVGAFNAETDQQHGRDTGRKPDTSLLQV